MKIAITGGTGFVGAAMVEFVRTQGHEAIALSRRNGGDLCDAGAMLTALQGLRRHCPLCRHQPRNWRPDLSARTC